MITHLRVKNYRGLRDVSVALGDFHVLVGPNGSGKSTLLDVFSFLRDCLNLDLREAVRQRAGSLDELTFGGRGGSIQFELQLNLEQHIPEQTNGAPIQYKLAIQSDSNAGVRVVDEQLSAVTPEHVFKLVKKSPEGVDSFFVESSFVIEAKQVADAGRRGTSFEVDLDSNKGGVYDDFEFGKDTLALSKMPPAPKRYPVSWKARSILAREVHLLNFVPQAMARPCPALELDEFLPDGHNLARVAGRLLNPKANGHDFDTAKAKEDWLYHLRLALPDLADISWAQRPDDRAEYLRIHYRDGLIVPSWALSEGTLRMLGLTLPAFLPPRAGIHLIEEPENAVHPHALEVIVNALRAIPKSQVLVTTHSPLLVDLVGKQPLLIFVKQDGAVTITPGDQHPALSNWDRSPALSSVFSAGYLE